MSEMNILNLQQIVANEINTLQNTIALHNQNALYCILEFLENANEIEEDYVFLHL